MPSPSGPQLGAVATGSSISAAIDIPQSKRNACGCGCKCENCSCRSRVDMVDGNREKYGGEGTLAGLGALPTTTQPTSCTSGNSLRSVKESSDAPVPATNAPQSYDTIRSIHGGHDSKNLRAANLERFFNEPNDECPWGDFLEQSMTSDTAGEDDAAPFGPMELDGSMQNDAPPFDNGEPSPLSSFMSSLSLHSPSVGTSDVVRGAGGIFGPRGATEPVHRYLRLN